MRHAIPEGRMHRSYMAILGVAAAIAVFGGVFAAALAASSEAATAIAPTNAGEPRTTGTAAVGQILRGTTGSWSGSDPKSYAFRWLRCDAANSEPDGSDCVPISGASLRTYEVRKADSGFRLRVRVTATNADGSAAAASNPTAVVAAAKPVNTDKPSISGTAVVGSRLQANRGTWTGDDPITYSFVWLRCNQQGQNCSEIQGANDADYEIRDSDVGRTIRVRVFARNDRGLTSAISQQTGVVGRNTPPPPPPGSSISVSDVPKTERLIASEVQFSPNPVTSKTVPITVRVRVKDTRGFVIRGALVFVRATPRVTSGDRQPTAADGWATFQLVPNGNFPQPRNGFNVQFFVKAYRAGDPPLAGIAGYRLVQVRLASS